jgi:hypothetical protein
LSPEPLIAEVTKTRSPQMIGLLSAMPGKGVRKRTFCPAPTFQTSGAPCPSPLPAASVPRKEGQGRGASRLT